MHRLLEILNKRNINNPLFCRALREYCAKHNLDIVIEDGLSLQTMALNDFYRAHEGILRHDDVDGLGDLEVSGQYEKIDSIFQ